MVGDVQNRGGDGNMAWRRERDSDSDKDAEKLGNNCLDIYLPIMALSGK